MEFLHKENISWEYTFADLFFIPQAGSNGSRTKVDLTPDSPLSTTLPIVSANMNSVTWKRMSETLARLGWLWVLPQDMTLEKTLEIIDSVHSAHREFDTALTVNDDNTIRDALWIIYKRSHDAVIMVDDNNKPIWIYSSSDLKWEEHGKLIDIKKRSLITMDEHTPAEDAFNIMTEKGVSSLPVVNKKWELLWMVTEKWLVRTWLYSPNLNKQWELNISVALWINDYKRKLEPLLNAWVDTLVLDTAHGLQWAMIQAIKDVRSQVDDSINIIAWNICEYDGAKMLFDAWANGVKVWIGPGAMCTTRMQTWVWRPQFSAVLDCSKASKDYEWTFVWADWGIKNPRDMAFAIAAGASHVMIWSILAGTYESTGDIKDDDSWKYKLSHGMASGKAVLNRTKHLSALEQAQKALFREWISESKVYMREWRESVWALLDEFTTGLRSTITYTWVDNISDFQDKAVIWVQTNAGFTEWTPHRILK